MEQKRGIGLKGADIVDGLMAMGLKEEAVGEAINLGSGEEHRVIDLANMVNELTLGERSKFYKDFFNYMKLRYYLEELLQRKIDLVIKNAVKPRLRKRIFSEVEYV